MAPSEAPHVSVSIPRECHLWRSRPVSRDDLRASLILVKTYEDESHLIRNLLHCTQCGHLYFHEFYEIVDWDDGNDAQYSTWIPVDDVESADNLSRLSPLALTQYEGIRVDFPSRADAATPPYWNMHDIK